MIRETMPAGDAGTPRSTGVGTVGLGPASNGPGSNGPGSTGTAGTGTAGTGTAGTGTAGTGTAGTGSAGTGTAGTGSAGTGTVGTGTASASAAMIESAAAEQAAAENFPVALRLLPRRYRQHLAAVYGFARVADDMGDEAPPAERLGLLDELEADLGRLYGGAAPRLAVVRGLAPAVAQCAIPQQPFRDLIEANRQDQAVTRYQSFDGLLAYCTLSANPVGRIVLHVFGVATPQREILSDRVCTALQLAEHWQDVAEDLRAGRVYLPAEDLDRFGCTERDLAASHAAPQVRALMSFEEKRARAA